MMPKFTGHALQLVGFSLMFLGLGSAASILIAATHHTAVPFWAFVTGAVVLGAPVMIIGGRINGRGRGLVLGMSPEQSVREYRQGIFVLAAYLAFLGLLSLLAVLPLLVRATGFAWPTDGFVIAWIIAWMLVFCGGRQWLTRPLWLLIERRTLAAVKSD